MSNRIVETLNLKVITSGLDEEQESDIVHLIDDTKELTKDAIGLSWSLKTNSFKLVSC